MEKSAASTEPQGPRPVLGRDSVQVPDDQDFRSFRSECEAEEGWNLTYSKAGVSVWVQAVEMDRTLHKIKVGLSCPTCSLHCALAASDRESPAPPQGHRHLVVHLDSEGVSCQKPGGGTVLGASAHHADGPTEAWRGGVTHSGFTQPEPRLLHALACSWRGGLWTGLCRGVVVQGPSAVASLHGVPNLRYPRWGD